MNGQLPPVDKGCGQGLHSFHRGVCVDCGAEEPQALRHALAEVAVKAMLIYAEPKPATVKKFLIQFECAESTRWLAGREEIARQLEIIGRSIAVSYTSGPVPLVTVRGEQ